MLRRARARLVRPKGIRRGAAGTRILINTRAKRRFTRFAELEIL